MAEGERIWVVQELSPTRGLLSIEKARVEMVEASLATKSACLDKSTTECVEVCCLLAKA